jgi:hypothetical protein
MTLLKFIRMIQFKFFIVLLALALPAMGIGQVYDSLTMARSEQWAREDIKNALKGMPKPFYDTLITDTETAIAVAEPILFKYYGKQEIESERPYQISRIDGYWYMTGSLPEGYKGGTFIIIINSLNGQVIRLIHGK